MRATPESNAAAAASPYAPDVRVEGVGPPLLFLPGMDGTGRLLYRQLPALSRRYRVVTFALRDEARTMDELVADVDGVLDRVAPEGERATLVGESFGGTLALCYALARPERVAALVVLNSFARFLPQVRLRLARLAIRLIPWGAMAIVRRVTAARMHSRHTHRDELRAFLQITAATTKRGYLNRLGILRAYDVRDRLGDLRVPTLFLAAELDHLVPAVREAAAMARRAPNATMRVLEGHGHICLIAPNMSLLELLDEWQGPAAAPPAPSA